MATGDAAKTGKGAVPAREATAHGAVARLRTRRCGVITRDQDLVPGRALTTSMYVCVSHMVIQ